MLRVILQPPYLPGDQKKSCDVHRDLRIKCGVNGFTQGSVGRARSEGCAEI